MYEDGFYLHIQENGDHSFIERFCGDWYALGSDEYFTDEDVKNDSVAIYRIAEVITNDGQRVVVKT